MRIKTTECDLQYNITILIEKFITENDVVQNGGINSTGIEMKRKAKWVLIRALKEWGFRMY